MTIVDDLRNMQLQTDNPEPLPEVGPLPDDEVSRHVAYIRAYVKSRFERLVEVRDVTSDEGVVKIGGNLSGQYVPKSKDYRYQFDLSFRLSSKRDYPYTSRLWLDDDRKGPDQFIIFTRSDANCGQVFFAAIDRLKEEGVLVHDADAGDFSAAGYVTTREVVVNLAIPCTKDGDVL